jgi:hypothetical protein
MIVRIPALAALPLLVACTAPTNAPTVLTHARFDATHLVPEAAEKLRVAGAMPLYVLGDVNGDWRLDERDAQAVADAIADPAHHPLEGCLPLGDLDADGQITEADLRRLERRIDSFVRTGRLETAPRMRVGSCPAILPFTVEDLGQPTVRVLADGLPVSVHAPAEARLASVTYDDVVYVMPLRQPDAPIHVAAKNPEGYDQVPLVTGESRYASGAETEKSPAGTPPSGPCPHMAERGAALALNLLASWKYDDPNAQKEQDDQLMAMHAALQRPEIEDDFLHYEGYNDAHLYPRPQRLVHLQVSQTGCESMGTLDSDTVAVGDQADVTVKCGTEDKSVPGVAISETKTIADQKADLTRWYADEDAAYEAVDTQLRAFEQLLQSGRSWALFYIGSHGYPPDDGNIPEAEKYGYWATGLGWRIWWNRADVLERVRAAAQAGGTCYFTVFDDSCESGYSARFGIDKSSRCTARPAFSVTDGGKGVYADRWLGVSTDSRSAMLDECIAREQELVDAVDRSMTDTAYNPKGWPKEWLWYLKPDHFGQAYVDRGYNGDECR